MQTDFLAEFTKSGSVTTNALGISDVVFTKQIPYDVSYVVILTVGATLVQNETVSAVPTNLTQTGFTITTYDNRNPPTSVVPNMLVYWLVVPKFNS